MKTSILFYVFFLIASKNLYSELSKPVVLVTIPPYAYFVKQISGDLVSTSVLIPPGANPHIYEITPRQAEKALQAKIWFRFGDPIENKVLPFFKEKQIPVIDLSQRIHLLPFNGDSCCQTQERDRDFHMWLDPKIVIQQILQIKNALSLLLPDSKELLDQNYQKLVENLQKMDSLIEKKLAPYKNAYLLVSHPSLQYYCHRYGLSQLSVEYEGKDPKPQQIASVMKDAVNKKVNLALTQPQYNNKGLMLIAEKLKIPVYEIDPYTEDYPYLFNHLSQLILESYDN